MNDIEDYLGFESKVEIFKRMDKITIRYIKIAIVFQCKSCGTALVPRNGTKAISASLGFCAMVEKLIPLREIDDGVKV